MDIKGYTVLLRFIKYSSIVLSYLISFVIMFVHKLVDATFNIGQLLSSTLLFFLRKEINNQKGIRVKIWYTADG